MSSKKKSFNIGSASVTASRDGDKVQATVTYLRVVPRFTKGKMESVTPKVLIQHLMQHFNLDSGSVESYSGGVAKNYDADCLTVKHQLVLKPEPKPKTKAKKKDAAKKELPMELPEAAE